MKTNYQQLPWLHFQVCLILDYLLCRVYHLCSRWMVALLQILKGNVRKVSRKTFILTKRNPGITWTFYVFADKKLRDWDVIEIWRCSRLEIIYSWFFISVKYILCQTQLRYEEDFFHLPMFPIIHSQVRWEFLSQGCVAKDCRKS
jgi:hypothetical protein